MSVQDEAKHALMYHLCLFNCNKMSVHTYHALLQKTKHNLRHDLRQPKNLHQYHVLHTELSILNQ